MLKTVVPRTLVQTLKSRGMRLTGSLHKIPTKPLALPERRSRLQRDIHMCEFLGQTPDGMQIYLSRLPVTSSLMKEIGRLRELSFRAIGEGTGKLRDLDRYDSHYLHLVLWQPREREVAGSYRMADSRWAMQTMGEAGLYSGSLFHFRDGMRCYLDEGLELGRSFVRPKYQGSRSLDYLWQGIGAFLTKYPGYRYLFGAVSISNSLPSELRDMLVYFYGHYYGADRVCAISKQPYRLDEMSLSTMQSIFSGVDCTGDFIRLKAEFSWRGYSIPTLYKQYPQVAEPGGLQFMDFGIDRDFGDCIDGLIVLDLTKLKSGKRLRYLETHTLGDKAA